MVHERGFGRIIVYLLVTCLSLLAASPLMAETKLDFRPGDTSLDSKSNIFQTYDTGSDKFKTFTLDDLKLLQKGGQDASGGNSFEASFTTLGMFILGKVIGSTDAAKEVDTDKLELTIKSARVLSTPHRLKVNGEEVFALHSVATQTILFSEIFWKELGNEQRKKLVLHEYLALYGLKDFNHLVSKRLLSLDTITLIPPMVNEIYREVILPKNIFSFGERQRVSARVDGIEENIWLARDPKTASFAVGLSYGNEERPRRPKTVWFSGKTLEARLETKLVDSYESEVIEKRAACLQKIQSRAPITKLLLEERYQIVVACWGPGEYPEPDLSPAGEFKALGVLMFNKNSELDAYLPAGAIQKYAEALKNVQVVETSEPLFINDRERHAVNSLEKKNIFLNIYHWRSLSPEGKRVLVIHEYLRFTGLDDSTYAISSEIANLQNVTLIKSDKPNVYHTLKLFRALCDGDSMSFSDHQEGLLDGTPHSISKVERSYVPATQLTFKIIFSDPIHGGKFIYFELTKDMNQYSPAERPTAQRCLRKLQATEPLTTFILGERNETIVDCW